MTMDLNELMEAQNRLIAEIKAKDERIHDLEKTLGVLQKEFNEYIDTVADIHGTLASVVSEFSCMKQQHAQQPHPPSPHGSRQTGGFAAVSAGGSFASQSVGGGHATIGTSGELTPDPVENVGGE